ncbi:MAG: YcbK family protein [Rubrimonas sp.]
MTTNPTATISRRGLLAGLGAAFALAPAAHALAAPAVLTGAGDIRMIRLVNPRTGDKVSSVYWIEGAYVPEVMSEISHLMRDWRVDRVKAIDPGLIDIISAAHKRLDTSEPFTVYSGYRTPQTNAALRQNSRGVASNSYHIKGMAADLHLEGRSVRQISGAALSLKAGGVGKYSRSNFVHMDCGPVRDWGR